MYFPICPSFHDARGQSTQLPITSRVLFESMSGFAGYFPLGEKYPLDSTRDHPKLLSGGHGRGTFRCAQSIPIGAVETRVLCADRKVSAPGGKSLDTLWGYQDGLLFTPEANRERALSQNG